MDAFTIFTEIAAFLGHFLAKVLGLQKNVVDDVLMEIIKKLPKRKVIDEKELQKVLLGLDVKKIHVPGYKSINIKYKQGEQ
jgi:hypothetical protein